MQKIHEQNRNRKNEKEKRKSESESKQNEPPLISIVVYHDTNQDGQMESIKGCLTHETKKNSYIFFNQRFVQQTLLLGIDSVKKIAPKEWFNQSKRIDHPFQKKLRLARNEAI